MPPYNDPTFCCSLPHAPARRGRGLCAAELNDCHRSPLMARRGDIGARALSPQMRTRSGVRGAPDGETSKRAGGPISQCGSARKELITRKVRTMLYIIKDVTSESRRLWTAQLRPPRIISPAARLRRRRNGGGDRKQPLYTVHCVARRLRSGARRALGRPSLCAVEVDRMVGSRMGAKR